MFLHGSHSPAAGSSEGHAGGWKKSSQCLQSLQTGMGWDGTGGLPVCSLPVPLPFSLAPHQPPAATSLREAKRQHDKASNSQT